MYSQAAQTIPATDITWREVLADSYRALRDVVANITPDQLELATPCADWNVAKVIQHTAGDQLAWAMSLGRGTGPSDDPFAPSGRLDVTPQHLVDAALEQATAAWATVADDADTVATPLPHGDLPTGVAAASCGLDAAVHAWDLAVVTGQDSPLHDDLAAVLLAAATGVVEPLRQWGAYAPIVPGADGDTEVDRLLRYLGREPR